MKSPGHQVATDVFFPDGEAWEQWTYGHGLFWDLDLLVMGDFLQLGQ